LLTSINNQVLRNWNKKTVFL